MRCNHPGLLLLVFRQAGVQVAGEANKDVRLLPWGPSPYTKELSVAEVPEVSPETLSRDPGRAGSWQLSCRLLLPGFPAFPAPAAARLERVFFH